jgi:hypothetical protein
MSVAEYEAGRSDRTLFFVAPSDAHFWPDIERLVERYDRYFLGGGSRVLCVRLASETKCP